MKNILWKLYNRFPRPQITRLKSLQLFEWMNRNAPGKQVLNMGSGIGNFDRHLSESIKMINLDIDPTKPRLDVVADAHSLPFKNECLDIVFSITVLEHVRKPWVCAAEMTRVLKPGGHVVLLLPFLYIIHHQHDYFRFTDKGIRSLFDETSYDVVLEQVGAGGGSFLSGFLLLYFQQFIPTKVGRALWYSVMRYIFKGCKYLDAFIDHSPDLRITASLFTFIGKKK